MFETVINGVSLKFETHRDLFSPLSPDKGTMAMLSLCAIGAEDKVLDLGCGYGTVGVYVSSVVGPQNVTMTDVSERAVEYARKNLELNGFSGAKVIQSDGFENITERDYTLILSNPPYHTDFSVAKGFIEQGRRHLVTGGRMVMVTKRRLWYENKLKSVFGGVKVIEAGDYFVFISEKRPYEAKTNERKNANGGMSKKLARKNRRQR